MQWSSVPIDIILLGCIATCDCVFYFLVLRSRRALLWITCIGSAWIAAYVVPYRCIYPMPPAWSRLSNVHALAERDGCVTCADFFSIALFTGIAAVTFCTPRSNLSPIWVLTQGLSAAVVAHFESHTSLFLFLLFIVFARAISIVIVLAVRSSSTRQSIRAQASIVACTTIISAVSVLILWCDYSYWRMLPSAARNWAIECKGKLSPLTTLIEKYREIKGHYPLALSDLDSISIGGSSQYQTAGCLGHNTDITYQHVSYDRCVLMVERSRWINQSYRLQWDPSRTHTITAGSYPQQRLLDGGWILINYSY